MKITPKNHQTTCSVLRDLASPEKLTGGCSFGRSNGINKTYESPCPGPQAIVDGNRPDEHLEDQCYKTATRMQVGVTDDKFLLAASETISTTETTRSNWAAALCNGSAENRRFNGWHYGRAG